MGAMGMMRFGHCRRRWYGCGRWLAAALLLGQFAAAAAGRLTLNFNPDWKFLKADPAGAFENAFDDRGWMNVSTPHTFNDTDTFDDWSLSGHRGEQNQWSGRTWYRKSFTPPAEFRGNKIFLEFEAARQVAEVYLNGKLLGVCKTGFTPFGFDLTPQLRFGETNVLAVMCDNRFMKDPWGADGPGEPGRTNGAGGKLAELAAKFNAQIPEALDQLQADQIPWNNPHWHPAHGGIYRNVYLHVTDPLHISLPLYSFLQTVGPYVFASEISTQSAVVNLQVPVENARGSNENLELCAELFDGDGKSVLTLAQAGELAAGAKREFALSGKLARPAFWSPARPNLYRVVCSVLVNGAVVDAAEIPLGIRSANWSLATGFSLNGHHLKLHGWGQKPTGEWPGLGAALPDWLHFYTLRLMKEAGGNFVRWGHCAAGPASLMAADRLGLVIDQPGVDGESDTRGAAWTLRVSAFRDTLIYFRNHPSILLWEGGNQKVTREHARELRALVDQYDPQGGRAYTHRRADKITAEFMTVGLGTEGGREIAELPVIEAEYNREEAPRRVWDNASPPNFGYPEAKGQTYQLTSEQYAVNQIAQYVRKLGAPEHGGGANWIFTDSTSGGRVACEVARASGEVDAARLPKEAYYVCRAMYRADPQVHIIGHWNYPAGTKKDVFVAANGEEVELFVNGKSLGYGKNSDRYLFTFSDVTWETGEIKAVSYVAGKPAATQTKHTVGPAVALRITPIVGPEGFLAEGSDVALFDVEAVDARGERCPTFQQRAEFELAGPAVWRGGYESGRTNSINQTTLALECGINRVAVRATRKAGEVTLRVRTEGLQPGVATVTARAFAVANQFATTLPALPTVAPTQDCFGLAAMDSLPVRRKDPKASVGAAVPGRFTRSFSYAGPASTVCLATDAQPGKKIYADRECTFAELPAALRGGDYVQAANADKLYNAVDLMELAVPAGALVSIAHDDRLPRPAWLTRQFTPSDTSLLVDGKPLRIFQHRAQADESLTLGANTEDAKLKTCNMYLVFITAPERPRAAQTDDRSQ